MSLFGDEPDIATSPAECLKLTVTSTDRRNTLPFEMEVKCDAATTEAPFLYGGGEC
jgi:hypothetical protein